MNKKKIICPIQFNFYIISNLFLTRAVIDSSLNTSLIHFIYTISIQVYRFELKK